MAGGSIFCWVTGSKSNNSVGALQFPRRLTLVPVKESGVSLGRPLSYQLNRSMGLSAVGHLPVARSLKQVGSAAVLGFLQLVFAMMIINQCVEQM